MSVPTRAAFAVLGVAAVSCALVAASSPAFAAPGNGKSALAGSVPSWAQAAHKVGVTNKTTQVDFRVYLNNRGGDAAAAYATAVSSPGNALYGKFLTAAQYRDRFAPAQSDVDAVSTWLKSQGLKVGYVPDNRKYVEATGTVAQAAAAFGTSFSDYTVQGQQLRANDTPLVVPSSLGSVEGVIGLDETMALARTPPTSRQPVSASVSPARRTGARRPCTTRPRWTAPSFRARRRPSRRAGTRAPSSRAPTASPPRSRTATTAAVSPWR